MGQSTLNLVKRKKQSQTHLPMTSIKTPVSLGSAWPVLKLHPHILNVASQYPQIKMRTTTTTEKNLSNTFFNLAIHVTIWQITYYQTIHDALALLAPSKMSNSVKSWAISIFWRSWLTALGQFFSDVWDIPIASSQIRLPLINVRIPVKVARGKDGSCWDLESSCVVFLKSLACSCGRCENQNLSSIFFSRAFRALIPSRPRNVVGDTIIIATAPSIWCQNTNHTMSKVLFWTRPETRIMAMMIIQTLRHNKMPQTIFCWRLILAFQSTIKGIDMTMLRG